MNIEFQLRRAGVLVAAGLLLQFLSLLPLHPLAFIAFVGLGVPVMVLGVILYVLTLLHHAESPEK